MQKFFARLRRFIEINIWVEKVMFKAVGWFYAYEIFQNLYDKLYGLIDSFVIAIVINTVIANAGNPELIIQIIAPYVAGLTIFRLSKRVVSTIFWNFRYLRKQFAFDVYYETALMKKLGELNWEHIENAETEKNINITFTRSRAHMETLTRIHINIISLIVSLIFILATAKLSFWIYLLIFIKELPSIIMQAKWTNQSYKISDQLHPIHSRMGELVWYYRKFATLLEIKLTNAKQQLEIVRRGMVKIIYDANTKMTRSVQLPSTLLDIYETVINVGVYIYFLGQVIFQHMPFGTFQYVTSSVDRLGGALYQILSQVPQSLENYRYIRFAYDFFRIQNRIPNGHIKFAGDKIDIEFRNVWFKYDKAKNYALKNVNIKIDDNDRIALVGENGAGKSTFLKLLMVVFYPTKGDIFINGINLREYDKETLYAKLSLVSQDFARYSALSAMENIAITETTTNINMRRVKLAAKYADADTFIEKLNHGYDTILSKQYPEGTELSTGQWQRIAVARQFYANRPLVILDEPTASIDPIAEAKIFNNLYTYVKDKTVIVVSHRYNTVRAAKKILVFNDGQIIEQGTHEELIRKGGYYKRAYTVQHEEKKL